MPILDIKLPVDEVTIDKLRAGDRVLITGVLYAARDAAHRRIAESLKQGRELPFDIKGQAVYYMGPAPSKPGHTIGSAGPTTSGRMDSYVPRLLAGGLKMMIGKGERSPAVKDAIRKYRAIYLAATGGAGAMISKSIKESRVIAYPELGPEAVLRLVVEKFPAVVVNDIYGSDLYQEGRARYRSVL